MDNIRMDYYSASWCGPCRLIAPIVEELKADGWQINKIDADSHPDKVAENKIFGIPTFIIYKNDEPVRRFTGARQKAAILAELMLASE